MYEETSESYCALLRYLRSADLKCYDRSMCGIVSHMSAQASYNIMIQKLLDKLHTYTLHISELQLK